MSFVENLKLLSLRGYAAYCLVDIEVVGELETGVDAFSGTC